MPTFTTARLRRSCWIAIFAMLALALLPSVSRALSAGRGAGDIEVCTPAGFRLIAAADRGAPDEPAGLEVRLEHCPLCSLTAHALGMPPAPLAALPLAPAAAEAPPRRLQAAPAIVSWARAQPRAPPARS